MRKCRLSEEQWHACISITAIPIRESKMIRAIFFIVVGLFVCKLFYCLLLFHYQPFVFVVIASRAKQSRNFRNLLVVPVY